MNLEKQKKFLISFAFYALIAIGVILAVMYLLPPLMPFVIGLLIALVLRRPSLFISKKLHIHEKITSIVLAIALYALAISLLTFLGLQIASVLGDVLPTLPDVAKKHIIPSINKAVIFLKEFLVKFDVADIVQIDSWFSELSSSIISMITSFSTSAVKIVSGLAAETPNFILKVVLTVISTFYFSIDYTRIMDFIFKILPKKAQEWITALRQKGLHSLGIFIRSYILVFIMTFCELSLGFFILKLPYPALIGLVVAVIDILPVLGTGLVLLPWSLIEIILGNYFLGVGLLLLYIIITVIRNVVEPKLVGEQIGLYPLLTLISMFLGLQLLGLIGLFLFPVTLSIGSQFYREAVSAKKEKSPPEPEPSEK